MKKAPYSALGGVFEYLNVDCGYEEWSQYLIEKLRALPSGACGADVGCGNGYFTRAFKKAGYNVVGIDLSEEMLSEAARLAAKDGLKLEFLIGDITKLKLPSAADFITAVNDCLNYVAKDKLIKAFRRVYANLKKGGLFIFDISSERKLRETLGNNLFAEDGEEITWLWFNSLKDDRVEMDITLFVKNPDGSYSRSDESQTQFIHAESEVLAALEEVGFEVVAEGHLGKSKEDRINFICKKI